MEKYFTEKDPKCAINVLHILKDNKDRIKERRVLNNISH